MAGRVPDLVDIAEQGLRGALEAERRIQPGGNVRASWEALLRDARGCTRCELHKCGTQTVFGEGPLDASIVFVGEQPGDQEDLAGRPFVGPAGQLFDQALDPAGIDRSTVYVTNAVKHFKFILKGKRRIHNKPDAGEISACKWWLEQERELIRPPVTVALGATAARSLIGRVVTIGKVRGEPLTLADGSECWVTVHPSALLRMPEPDRRREERALRRGPQADPRPCGGNGSLEGCPRSRTAPAPSPCGRSGRVVVVVVRGREIVGVEDVLDVDLRFDAAGQLVVTGGVEARIAGQLHGVAERRERLRARDQAKAEAYRVGHLVAVPQREAVARDQRDFAAFGAAVEACVSFAFCQE